MTRPIRIALLASGAAFAAVALSAPGFAKPQPSGAAVVKDLKACREISDNQARLRCYDGAVDALDKAEQSGEVVVLDKQQVKEARKDAFGFTMPSFKMFDRGEKPEQIDEVTLTLDHAYRNRDGKWVLKTDSGQTWVQIDTYDLFKSPKKGSTMVVKRASLGSYVANIDGQKSIRVRRQE